MSSQRTADERAWISSKLNPDGDHAIVASMSASTDEADVSVDSGRVVARIGEVEVALTPEAADRLGVQLTDAVDEMEQAKARAGDESWRGSPRTR